MLDRLQNAIARQRAFVADASHELRTPLTVLTVQIELLALQEQATAEYVAHACKMIGTEITRMGRLVDDLRVLARSDERVLLQPRIFDVAPFLELCSTRFGRRRSVAMSCLKPRLERSRRTRIGSPRCCATFRATRSSTPTATGWPG